MRDKKGKTPHWKRKVYTLSFAIAAVALIVLLGLITFGQIQNYWIEKDTVAWMERAQVASDPKDMEEYLRNCEAGMQAWKLTQGNAAYVFKKPDNDLALITRSLNTSIKRAHKMQQADPSSDAYQAELYDLRGVIREIDLHTPYGWWVLHGSIFIVLRFVMHTIAIISGGYWVWKYEEKTAAELKEEASYKVTRSTDRYPGGE